MLLLRKVFKIYGIFRKQIFYFIGILLRKAPGNKLFDFGHFIALPYTESLEDKKILLEMKNPLNPAKKINQANYFFL